MVTVVTSLTGGVLTKGGNHGCCKAEGKEKEFFSESKGLKEERWFFTKEY